MFWKKAKTNTTVLATLKRISFSHDLKDDTPPHGSTLQFWAVNRSLFSVLATDSNNKSIILYVDANEHPAMRIAKEGDSVKFELNSLFDANNSVQNFKCVVSMEITDPI